MRDSEEWPPSNAEKYASLAWLDGNAYPAAELTEAWKKITFNQFHDLAAGSGIGVIYKDAQRDYDTIAISQSTRRTKQQALFRSSSSTRSAGNARPGLSTDVQLPSARQSVLRLDAEGGMSAAL
jgi:alpha-mannosidase